MPHVPEPFKPGRTLTESIKSIEQIVAELEGTLDRAKTLLKKLERAQRETTAGRP